MPRRRARERARGHEGARPRPLEVEAADPAVDVEDFADAGTAPGRLATPSSPDRSRRARRRRPSLRRRCSRASRRPAAAIRPARATAVGDRHAAGARARLAVDRELAQHRVGNRGRQHRCDRGAQHGLRARRRDTLQVGVDVSNWRPGQKLTVIAASRPSSFARSQWRDAFSATGPLTPKCVQSSAPPGARRWRRRPTPPARPPVRRRTAGRGSTGSANTSGASAGVVGTIVWPSRFAIS